MSTEPNSTAAPMSSPTTNDDAALEIAALTKRAQFLNVQYGVLFGASMLLLVYNWTGGRTMVTTIAWAASLLGAVVTRVVRTSLVNKINKREGGRVI